jgi:hypothetical protein
MYRGELQDYLGNVLHPETEAKNVYISQIPEITGCTTSQDVMQKLSSLSQQLNTDITNLKTIALSPTGTGTIASQGNATQADVLAPKTFSNGSSINLIGAMPNNGTISKVMNCGETFNLPKGYIDGGTITVNSLASQTTATATAGDIIAPKTAIVNGVKITGTVINRDYQESATGTWTDGNGMLAFKIPTGAYVTEGAFGAGIAAPISYDPSFIAENIVNGKTVFGLAGTGTTISSLSGTATMGTAGSNRVFSINPGFVPKIITCAGSVCGEIIIFNPTGLSGTTSYALQVGGSYYIANCTATGTVYKFDAGYSTSSGGVQGSVTWVAYTW